MTKIEELKSLKVVSPYDVENRLSLVFEGEDYGKRTTICCDLQRLKHLPSTSWTSSNICESCNRVTVIFPQDRMGGMNQDPYKIWEEPSENNPFVDLIQLNDFLDFYSKKDESGRSYDNVWRAARAYKEHKRKP